MRKWPGVNDDIPSSEVESRHRNSRLLRVHSAAAAQYTVVQKLDDEALQSF